MDKDRSQWYRENDFRNIKGYKRITADEMNDEGAQNLLAAIVKGAVDDYKADLTIQWINGASYEEAEGYNEINYDSLISGKKVKEIAKRIAWKEYQELLKEEEKKKTQKRRVKTHAKHVSYNKSKKENKRK